MQKANTFRELHIKGNPVVLYNVWDPGVTKAVAQAGAKAIATGSWSVAASQGYDDGQHLPLHMALDIAERIVTSTALPVTVDFEGGYANDPREIAGNVTRLLQTGAIGLNFEDQIIGSDGLYDTVTQAARIAAVRQAAIDKDIPAVINARTDLFLKESDSTRHGGLIEDAVNRAAAYQEAGADCFFVPGLSDYALITKLCNAVALPVNVMVRDTGAEISDVAKAGVARISFGPAPYLAAMTSIETSAGKHFRS